MRTRIKFCGLVRAEDVDTAVALGVDAIGFVFYPPSPRALGVDDALALRKRLPSFVSAVGLFVNEAPDTMTAIASRVGLDVIQLHGDETPVQGREMSSACGLAWWKAIRMRQQLQQGAGRHSQARGRRGVGTCLRAYLDMPFRRHRAVPARNPRAQPHRCRKSRCARLRHQRAAVRPGRCPQ